MFSCRPTAWPFWFGFVMPFALIWLFNWAMFTAIMISLCRHAIRSSEKKGPRSIILRHLFIAMVLSLLFGLGWVFGVTGSTILPPALHKPARYLFNIFIGLQGVLIFVLHAVRSPDAREEWKHWWYCVTCKRKRALKVAVSYSGSKVKGTSGRSDSTVNYNDSGTAQSVIKSPNSNVEE